MAVDQSIVSRAVRSDPFELDVYRRSQANLRRLKDTLPEELVFNFAREVILRVASKERVPAVSQTAVDQAELENLSAALISEDDKAASKIIGSLRSNGAQAEDIYLKQLAGAARMLGEWWEEDRVGFAQVTIGTSRLFAIMRSMRHLFEPNIPSQDKTAVFASVPGEDHTLGIRMAADMFRKDGWEISLKVGLSHDQLVAQIEECPTGIVGLSISGHHSVEALSRLVVALHICCPRASIVVSGQNIDEVRPVLSLMGLDGIASSFDEAKQQLNALWDTNMAV